MISEMDLVRSVFEHRMRERDLDSVLSSLSNTDRQELLNKFSGFLHHLSGLVNITHELSQCHSLDTALPRFMEIVTETFRAERGTLFLHDAHNRELFSRIAQGGTTGEIRIPDHSGVAGSVFTSGEGVIIDDAYDDARFNREVDLKTGFHTRNILCTPLRNSQGLVFGVAQVLNKHGRDFDQNDLILLNVFGTQASSALENARLLDEVALARQEEAQLFEVATAISTELQIEPLLEKIVTVTTEILHADRSTLFLHDKRTDELWSRVAEGMNSREIRFPASAGLAGSCFTTGETINIPNAYKDPRFNQEVDLKTGYKTRNILCVPITSRQGGSLGVMQVLNHEKGPFRTVDEERLRAFAAQASVALENAQLFSDVQNARNYNESILQSLSNAVVTLDEDGHVEKINEAAERVLGMDHRAVGEKIDRWITDANPWIAASVQRAQDGRSSDSAVDQVMVRPDGDKVSINLTTVPLVDVQEKHLGTMLVAEDITEEKRLRGTMARYMTKEVMDKLLEAGEEALGGTAQEVAILFSDIVGFTPLSESLGARETVIMLNEYFSKMVDVVFQHGGVLDKYIGDAIMALFGAPFHNDNDADNALTVGNEMMAALRVLNSGREQRGQQLIRIGVGLSCGEVIAGNIGSPRRMDYTVIGDNVNLAARLESANRFYGTGILLCQQLVDKLTGSHKLREVDCVRVKGQVRPVVVFEALGHHTPETFPNMDRALLHFEQGMKLYKKWEWRQSAESFGEVLQLHPGDELSAFYQKQCNLFQATPPPPEWDGVRDFLVK